MWYRSGSSSFWFNQITFVKSKFLVKSYVEFMLKLLCGEIYFTLKNRTFIKLHFTLREFGRFTPEICLLWPENYTNKMQIYCSFVTVLHQCLQMSIPKKWFKWNLQKVYTWNILLCFSDARSQIIKFLIIEFWQRCLLARLEK